jgi:tetratricopeptide (TPR) repeat protein
MRAASAAIAFEAVGEQELKGKASPVPAWRALRVVAQRGGQGRGEAIEPPFVGRDEELRLLKDALHATGREQRVRLISITGPAGIGKSRLAWELEKYLDGVVEAVFWHRGRSPSYGEGIAFWALGEMVRRRAGLSEDDDAETTRDRISATLDDYVPDPVERRWVEPALLGLLGVDGPPAGGRDVLFAGWRMFFERVAHRGTTVLLFEDLQWADDGLLEFIEHLLEWSKGVPLLVIALARPELLERRPDWGAATRNHTRIALEPLSPPAMRELLAGFVPGLPGAAVDAILARADGIPLYAVETVRSLVAEGRLEHVGDGYRPTDDLATFAIPATLRSLIASRLDALDPVDRGLVADASVLGLTFSTTPLAALSGLGPDDLERRLRALVRRELFDVETDPRSPELGQHRFVQSLIREVAYGTLARRDRRALHLAAARHFEALGDPELAGALAAHYVAARDASDAGPEADAVAIQARLALVGAADRATSLGSHVQAIRYLSDAASLTSDAGERAALLTSAARSATIASRHAEGEELARAAIAAATESGDTAAAALGRAALGLLLIDTGRLEDSATTLEEALSSLPAEGAGEIRAELLTARSRVEMRARSYREAVVTADEALELAERMGLRRLVAEALNNKGSALGFLGRTIEAQALTKAAAETARAAGDVPAELRAMLNAGGGEDDAELSRDWNRQTLDLARRVGNRMIANWAVGNLRFVDYELLDWDRAGRLDGYGESIDDVDHSTIDEVRTLMFVGYVAVARGEDVEWVLERIRAVEARASRPIPTYIRLHIESQRALLAGRFEDALRDAEAGAREDVEGPLLASAIRTALWARDVEALRPFVARLDGLTLNDTLTNADRVGGHAAIAALEGRLDDARDGYRRSLGLLRDIHHQASMALCEMDMLVALGASDPAAREAGLEARRVFETVGARPYIAKLDAALADAGTDGRAAEAIGESPREAAPFA